jgi:hypothetical protein
LDVGKHVATRIAVAGAAAVAVVLEAHCCSVKRGDSGSEENSHKDEYDRASNLETQNLSLGCGFYDEIPYI